MSDIRLNVYRDGLTGGIQLAIDDEERGTGYRLAGPKFNGSGERLLTCRIGQQEIVRLREYLDRVQPAGSEETDDG